MRSLGFLPLILVAVLAGCGGEKKSDEGGEVQAACSGSALESVKLPAGFPTPDSVTYTEQSTQGPTEIVEGFFDGGVQAAHDEYKTALEQAGFTVLFDEVEEDDSEVSWKGKGRSGQVALRDECGDPDRTFVHVTNRPG